MIAVGPYTPEARDLQDRLNARGVVLLVVEGNRGAGCVGAVAFLEDGLAEKYMRDVPAALRVLAADVDRELAARAEEAKAKAEAKAAAKSEPTP